jgi:hypothetical protein
MDSLGAFSETLPGNSPKFLLAAFNWLVVARSVGHDDAFERLERIYLLLRDSGTC